MSEMLIYFDGRDCVRTTPWQINFEARAALMDSESLFETTHNNYQDNRAISTSVWEKAD